GGAALIPSFIWRKDKYNHFQIICEPLELETAGDKKDLIELNMQKMVKVLEKYIKEHIEEWEVFHDIWT
ncbi:MAG: lipid A biosynthesis acyltransferase, partial [Actinobacteria bacterium]|nr:lipid A biosynthesis acyltransferase [Actinomycetota bacterium]